MVEDRSNNITVSAIAERVKTNFDEKYSMDRFLDPDRRDDVFKELFREVNEINFAMKQFRTFFDNEGFFQEDMYKESGFRLTRKQHFDLQKVVNNLKFFL